MSRTHDCKPQRQHGTGAAGIITPSVTCTGSHDRRGTASSATTPGSMTTLGRGLAEWVCDHPSVHADDPLASDPLASLSRGFGALAVPDQARRRRPPRSRARRSCFCCCTSGGSRSNRPGTHHRRGPAGGSGLLAGGGEDCEGARRRGRRCALPTGPGLGRWAKGGAPAGAGRGATVMSSAVRRRSACTGPERSGSVDPGQICTSQSPQCPATSSPGATAGRAHHPTRHPVGCSGHEPFWHRLCLGHQAAPARSRRAWHGHPCPSIEQLNGCRGRSVTGRRSHARRVGACPGSASDRVAAAGGRPGQRAARCASLVVPVTERPTRTDPDRPCPTETAGRPSLFQSWLGVRGQRCGPSPAPRVSRKDPLRGDRQREPAKRALTGAGRIDSNAMHWCHRRGPRGC